MADDDKDPSKHGMRSVPAPVEREKTSLSGRSPAKERATKGRKIAERSDEEVERVLAAKEAAEKAAADIAKMWPSNEPSEE